MSSTAAQHSFKLTRLAMAVLCSTSALAAPTVADVYAQAKVGQVAAATAMATVLVEENPRNAAALEARAYVLRGQKRYTEALGDYQRLLELDPKSRPGLIGTVASLRAMGSAQLAQQYAAKNPELFAADEMQAIEHAVASAFTRLGATDTHTGSTAFELTDKALSQFDVFKATSQLQDASQLPGFIGFDYLVAQFNRRRFDVVCKAFEALEQKSGPLPDYVIHVAAQSYASLRQPVRSLALLDPISERNKDDVDFVQSFFYALVDNEQHGRAQAWLDAAVARTPSHLDANSPRLRRPNPNYVRLVALAAWARAFDDRLPAARQRFEAALAEAPANESLRDGLGTVELWSGRPRAARAQFQQAIALNHSAIESRRGLLAALAARGDEKSVREGLDALQARTPFDAQLARQRVDQAIRTGASVSFGLGRSTAHVPAKETSPEYNGRMRFKSALFKDHLRVIAGGNAVWSAPDGDTIAQNWNSVGLEWQQRDLVASASVARDRNGGAGLSLTSSYDATDDLAFSAEVDSLAADIPSRAAQAGVTGRRVAVSAEWQPRVETSLSAHVSSSHLTDDNVMTSASVKWREMWHQQADRQVWTALSASRFASTNQLVSYFSPRSSAGLDATLGVSVLGVRKAWLDRSLWHHVEVDVGRTTQDGFSGRASGAIRYRAAYRHSARMGAELSVERARRVYDGAAEMQNAVRLEVSVAL